MANGNGVRKLNARQRAFVLEYLIDLNAAQAAIRAGYSVKTAVEMGYENLTKPHIAEAIHLALDARAKRTEVTADMVVKELAKVGFADMSTYVGWDDDGVALSPSVDLPDGATEVVSEITATTTETTTKDGDVFTKTVTKLKLHDKLAALDKLGKHLGMFTQRVELTGKDGGPLELSIMEMAKLAAANRKDRESSFDNSDD